MSQISCISQIGGIQVHTRFTITHFLAVQLAAAIVFLPLVSSWQMLENWNNKY
jgi:hypothetical protein